MSEYIRDLPFLWVAADDEPGPESDRAYIERNTIALVSNYASETIDPRTDDWLGRDSPRADIPQAGPWNSEYVDEEYDPAVLDRLERAIEDTSPA
ncbi:hypothetical protein [Halobaculum sp. EA56]|uniref:hypothetical protein n=1 Tax=Halobaculum sp. EA56 TaxID=3421648 RepID=UPI003EBAAEA8